MTGLIAKEIPIDPDLPEGFDCTPNDARPDSHMQWWGKPYIVTEHADTKWWPEGIRYDVRCLDGGAHDRSTWWGSFKTLAAAIAHAQHVARSLTHAPVIERRNR